MSTSDGEDTKGTDLVPGTEPVSPARQPPRWQRLWVVLCSRFPSLSVGRGDVSVEGEVAAQGPRRLRMLGFACLGVAVMVVLAGTTVGSLIGAAAVSVVKIMTEREPLVTGGTGVE
ncbi:hypothetical protein [uncultured Alsobacter sp.]|uniref:hypothetical protein n=1 Tax=uncultured Alsobacter sp. TaxID=1748258 RepID=UPI0025FB26A9|nr:hypothetical protein [uncultured Alsobacter sp.]